jgi:hypothetical protein
MDREKPPQPDEQPTTKQGRRLKNVSQVITNMLTELEPEDYRPPRTDPIPPERVADAVGWAPSMPPGPLLLDLAAHDPHKTKVPLSEAITQPPIEVNLLLKPPANMPHPNQAPPKRRLKSQVVVIGGAFIGAIFTVFGIAIAFWVFSYAT